MVLIHLCVATLLVDSKSMLSHQNLLVLVKLTNSNKFTPSQLRVFLIT